MTDDEVFPMLRRLLCRLGVLSWRPAELCAMGRHRDRLVWSEYPDWALNRRWPTGLFICQTCGRRSVRGRAAHHPTDEADRFLLTGELPDRL